MKISFEGSIADITVEALGFFNSVAIAVAADEPKPAKTKAKAAPKEEAPKVSSRRKGNGAAEPAPAEEAAEEETGDEITDADLSKAASEAARVISPPEVTAVIDQFGVGHMREMDQPQRREFLDLLKGKVAE